MLRKCALCCLVLLLSPSAYATKEIQFHYETSNTLYAIVRLGSTGKVWDVSVGNWAVWSDGDIGDYDLALAGQGGDFYTCDFPTGITSAGLYAVAIREQAAGAPAASDMVVGAGEVDWTGTAERSLATVQLASNGLDNIPVTAPTGVASDFREMVVQLWRRFFRKTTLTTTDLKTYADDGATVLTTQAVGETATTQTMGAAQ